MDLIEFLGNNILLIAVLLLAVFIYLVSLINKRRKEKFLHKKEGDNKHQ
jgi:hypothetical protein